MKSIKLNFALIAMILGVSIAVAMKAPATKVNFSQAWFGYNGSGDPTDPANYTKLDGQPPCTGTTVVCAILATNDSGSPDITPALTMEINNDLSGHHSSADVKLEN